MYKSIEKYTRGISTIPHVVEFYPSDIKAIADNNEQITQGLRGNELITISAIPGPSSDKPGGYLVNLWQPSRYLTPTAELTVGPDDAFTYKARRSSKPMLYKVTPPRLLKDRIAWALGATAKRNEIRVRDHMIDYYRRLIQLYASLGRVDEHKPMQFNYGRFAALVYFASDGTADIDRSMYYIDGFPTIDEAMDILEMARRRNGWYFSTTAKIDYIINLIKSEKLN